MSTSNCTPSVNPREQRGRAIAATGTIRQRGDLWLVPSQSGSDTYTVKIESESLRCTCPDHEVRRVKCKHIYAVEGFASKAPSAPKVGVLPQK